MEFSRQGYWSGLPFAPLGELPDPGRELVSPALADGFFTTVPPEKPLLVNHQKPKSTLVFFFVVFFGSVKLSLQGPLSILHSRAMGLSALRG